MIRPETAIFVAGTGSEEELFVLPLLTAPPPNSIPHKPGIVITFPVVVFSAPSDLQVVRLKALMVPVGVLFVTSSAPLKVPKLLGATAK